MKKISTIRNTAIIATSIITLSCLYLGRNVIGPFIQHLPVVLYIAMIVVLAILAKIAETNLHIASSGTTWKESLKSNKTKATKQQIKLKS